MAARIIDAVGGSAKGVAGRSMITTSYWWRQALITVLVAAAVSGAVDCRIRKRL